jgi:O-antigen ligase
MWGGVFVGYRLERNSAPADESARPLHIAAFVCLLAYAAFLHLFPKSALLALFGLGVYFILLGVLIRLRELKVRGGPSVLFVSIVPVVVAGVWVNDQSSLDWVVFVALLILCVPLSFSTHWISSAGVASFALLSVHGAATCFFFIFPSYFEQVYSTSALNAYPGAWDYRSGLTGHYAFNGMYAALGLIMASAVAFSSHGRWARRIGLALMLLFTCALLLTTKRAHLVFAVITVIWVVTILRRRSSASEHARRRPWRSALVLTTIGAAWFVLRNPAASQVFFRLSDGTGSVNDYSSGRLNLWAHAVDLWQSSPVLGVGWGGYRFAWVDGGLAVVSVASHNVPLQLLAETGIVGAFVVIGGYIWALAMTKRKLKGAVHGGEPGSQQALPWLCASFGIQLFIGMYSLVGNPLYDPPTFAAYFLAVAAASAVRPATHEGIVRTARMKLVTR